MTNQTAKRSATLHVWPALLMAIALLFIRLDCAAGQQAASGAEDAKITEFHSSASGEPKSSRPGPARGTPLDGGVDQEAPPPLGLGARQVKGFIEFGPRWRGAAGNENVYRSHVNLGSGMKLLHSDLEVTSPENTGILFDRFHMTMDDWGGDPYNTVTVRFEKFRLYDFKYRYQKVNYFNYVPEFDNPLFEAGNLNGQHTFDITRRMSNARLELFPDSKRFKVHFSYARNSSFGPSLTTYNAGGDEFVLPRQIKNSSDDYGIGVDFSLWKFRFSVEQGYRRFRDDEGLSQTGVNNIGNDPLPVFQGLRSRAAQLFLSSFARSYHLRGTFPTTRFAVTSQPHRRLSLTARVYYGDANLQSALNQALTGRVLQPKLVQYVSNSLTTNVASPTRPETVADASGGVVVTRRLTLSNTFRFDHFDVAGSTLLNELLFTAGTPSSNTAPARRTLLSFSNRRIAQYSYYDHMEARYELIEGLTLRSGFRYTHRHVNVLKYADDPFSGIGSSVDDSPRNTKTWLGGVSYRLRHDIRMVLDYENGSYDNVFTQADAIAQQRGRFRAQYRPSQHWMITVSGLITDMRRTNRPVIRPFVIPPRLSSFVTNQDRNRDIGFSASYFPTERLGFDIDYTRGHAGSSIDVLRPIPANQQLKYRENSHIGQASIDAALYKDLRLAVGYSLVNSSGSYPINSHRPFGRVSIPLGRRLQLNLHYQYYGYDERGRSVQDYHANMLTTSLRLIF